MDEFFAEIESKPAKAEAFGIWDDTQNVPVLLLQYDTEDVEFARGVQVGMIWQLLCGEVMEFEIPVYTSNSEMIMRMAEAAGYSFSVTYEGNQNEGKPYEWMLVRFIAE